LSADKAKLALRKFRLKESLALLIVTGCPDAYLDPKLTPSPDEYYKPMLEKLQTLETNFATDLEFPESENEEEQEEEA
jgi:hypothetical protein